MKWPLLVFACIIASSHCGRTIEETIYVHTWEDFILPRLPSFVNATYRYVFTSDHYQIERSTSLQKRADPHTDIACYTLNTPYTTLVSISGNTVINFINPPEATFGYCAHFLLVNASNVRIEGIQIKMSYGESVIKLKSGYNITLENVTLESSSRVGLIYAEDSTNPFASLGNLTVHHCKLIQHHPNSPDIYLNITLAVASIDLRFNYYGDCKYPRIASPDCIDLVYLPYYVDSNFTLGAPVVVYDGMTEISLASIEEALSQGYENIFIRGELDILEKITIKSGDIVITRAFPMECCATIAVAHNLNPAFEIVNFHLRLHNITVRAAPGAGVFQLRSPDAYPSTILSNSTVYPLSFAPLSNLLLPVLSADPPSSNYDSMHAFIFLDHVFMTNLVASSMSFSYGVLLLPHSSLSTPFPVAIQNSVIENGLYGIINLDYTEEALVLQNNYLHSPNGTSLLIIDQPAESLNDLFIQLISLDNKWLVGSFYPPLIVDVQDFGKFFLANYDTNNFFTPPVSLIDPTYPLSIYNSAPSNSILDSSTILSLDNVENTSIVHWGNITLTIHTTRCSHFLRMVILESITPYLGSTFLVNSSLALYFNGASDDSRIDLSFHAFSINIFPPICQLTNETSFVYGGYALGYAPMPYPWPFFIWTRTVAMDQSITCLEFDVLINASFSFFDIDIGFNFSHSEPTESPTTPPSPTDPGRIGCCVDSDCAIGLVCQNSTVSACGSPLGSLPCCQNSECSSTQTCIDLHCSINSGTPCQVDEDCNLITSQCIDGTTGFCVFILTTPTIPAPTPSPSITTGGIAPTPSPSTTTGGIAPTPSTSPTTNSPPPPSLASSSGTSFTDWFPPVIVSVVLLCFCIPFFIVFLWFDTRRRKRRVARFIVTKTRARFQTEIDS